MTPRHLYLALCIVGLVLPYAAFVPWLGAHGLAPALFVRDMAANPISRFFVRDVVVSAVAFLLFARLEARRLGMRGWWIVLPATLGVGVSLGLPLFLYLRQRILDRRVLDRHVLESRA
ncbi:MULTISPECIES: DUF2834 domain-containing protein [Nguyenibacter]|uniref:DUF2834 domain-containing protein n=1 Tax=Nguyenibacter vanlangensis TaxID=1216886 RepID=A0ABZ3D897_9PROT|nr:DUF2834 domain-containing protein [Nguyenibacter sp. L1]WRH88828.1 DUF2834 domain-containing protein [Nguyenibacter sp. L1]